MVLFFPLFILPCYGISLNVLVLYEPMREVVVSWCCPGGLPYLSYDRGFACENVVNYEVVLASGEIVNANAETVQDHWVALRGGANNCGVITPVNMEGTHFSKRPAWILSSCRDRGCLL